jgi:signal transduction histidine kinase
MQTANAQLLRVASSVLEQLDVDTVLERVLEAARELTGARYAALGVLDPTRGELARFITVGIDEETRRAIGPLPTGRGVLGQLIRHPQPLRLGDVAAHPFSYGFPVGHPPMRSFLGVPILVAGRPYGNLYLTEKRSGTRFTGSDEESAVLLAGFAGLAVDHAERFSGVEAERTRLEQTVEALDTTIQISRALGGETDLTVILELVAQRGRALVGARILLIELVRGDELELAAAAGELPPDLCGTRVALADTVASAALRAGRTQRLTDELNRVRFAEHGLGRLGIEAREGLAVPLVFRDQSYGVLLAIDRVDGTGFTAAHERLLESLATSAATAVSTARSAANERDRQRLAAAEAERGRWARELHDETLQALAGLRLTLAAARRANDPDRLAAAVDQSLAQLDGDIAALRGLITQLRPAALDQLGLEPAVLALAERAREGGVDVDVHVELADGADDSDLRLDADLETGIYRIVQETLTNARKHGSATRASVEVLEAASTVTVRVRDDGVGFDPRLPSSGFGLIGMRERTALLGGSLRIDSSPGEGTTVRVELPVTHRASGNRLAPPELRQTTG